MPNQATDQSNPDFHPADEVATLLTTVIGQLDGLRGQLRKRGDSTAELDIAIAALAEGGLMLTRSPGLAAALESVDAVPGGTVNQRGVPAPFTSTQPQPAPLDLAVKHAFDSDFDPDVTPVLDAPAVPGLQAAIEPDSALSSDPDAEAVKSQPGAGMPEMTLAPEGHDTETLNRLGLSPEGHENCPVDHD